MCRGFQKGSNSEKLSSDDEERLDSRGCNPKKKMLSWYILPNANSTKQTHGELLPTSTSELFKNHELCR